MINNDRIVPVQKIDLLTLFGTILSIHGTSYTVLSSSDVEGNFSVTGDGTFLANQPVKTIDFESGVTSATVYFVAANDYAGFAASEVKNDSATLYKAEFAGDEVTVTAISPVAE